jgi:3-isopropylmalate dehydrogenase
MQSSYSIAVLPGDGIGTEVMEAALTVLHAAGRRCGRRFDTVSHAAGAKHFADTGVALPDATLDACRAADAILFGAMGLPHVRGADGTEVIPQLDIRFALDLYAGVRPVRTWPGCRCRWPTRAPPRSTSCWCAKAPKGLFYARGRGEVRADEAMDTMKITRIGTARITDFALRLAQQRKARGRPGHLTNVDKANVFRSMAFWRQIVHERAAAFPDIALDDAYVDAMALNLVTKPWQYDVLVTENMFGDILSDLIASLVGGMGMAPSADIGDRWALFQPAHGTAPDIAGRGIANPTAMVLSPP